MRTKYILFTIAFMATAWLSSCNENDNNMQAINLPQAAFNTDKTDYTVGDIVQFTDVSVSADAPITQYFWHFGFEGKGNYSTEKNPTMTYMRAGKYVVKLTVTDESGSYATKADTLIINDAPAGVYFVKTDGNGARGVSWDDALSPEAVKVKLQAAANGDVFYFAAGTYRFGEMLNIGAGITIQGGYPANSTGKNTGITYPAVDATLFSGNNTHSVMKISSGSKVVMKGITITEGWSMTAARPGIHVENDVLELYYCTITDNRTTMATGGDAGGAGLYINNAKVYAYQTVISNNTSHNRGGGIRVHKNGSLTLEQCLVSGNKLDNGGSGNADYGSAITCDATAMVYCINTTVTGNVAGRNGAAFNAANATVYLISSTVANNTAVAQGNDLRLDSNVDKAHIINSIITSPESTTQSIYAYGTNTTTVNSNGNNIFGSLGGALQLNTVASDLSSQTFDAVFGTNILSDNGGYPQTLAPVAVPAGATVVELEAFKNTYNLTEGDVTKDQRGFTRPAGQVGRGAYDPSATR